MPPVELTRDVTARAIPSGEPITLLKGTLVSVMMTVGDSFTVSTARGMMARVEGADADALGRERPAAPPATVAGDGPVDEARVREALKTVFDPEIPINVVDLGLVYVCRVLDEGERVEIEMTMTAPGCGMGPVIAEDARRAVAALPGVAAVEVKVVFDPPWDRSMISEAARLQLGWL